MNLYRCLVLGLLMLCPTLAWAQASADLFTADYSSRAGNWDATTANDTYHTMARVAAGGPNGIDALETTFLVNGANEIYLGGSETISNPSNGVARYYRYYEWHHASNTFTANGSVVWRLKRMIIGDGGGGDRVIINSNAEAGAIHLEGIIDGSSVSSSGNMSLGTWHAVQIEVIYNASPTASTVKVWLDNDTYASPTFTVTHVAAVPSNNGVVGYGRYSNHTLASGQYIFREAAFRVATTFDSNWYGWISGGGGGGSSPRFSPSFLRRVSQEVEP